MLLLFSCTEPVYAVDTVPTAEWVEKYENRKLLPVESNQFMNWPEGPITGAESAIVMEVDTGSILYKKNVDERLFPASITKLMTAQVVMDHCNLSDIVTFTDEAIKNTEWGSSRIGMQAGEELTVEECLYGLLLGSANEVAYALAIHVGGNIDTFVEMMNAKAAQIGCTNTHFANASGLPDDNHYVSARDMALIAREFFKNETLSLISGTYSHVIPATNKVNEERPQENHHKMITGKKYAYEGIVGGKTGFTSVARQTLVTCAQRNGMRLICVVMMDESPNQFLDSAELLDYGFNHFQKLKICDYETRYNLISRTFFHTKLDVMGSSKSILSLNKAGYIVIPKTLEFEEADVEVQYLDNDSAAIAKLIYSVGGNYVGSTTIDYAEQTNRTFEFAKILTDETDKEPQKVVPGQKTVFVSIRSVIFSILKVLGLLLATILAVAFGYRLYNYLKRRGKKSNKRYKSRSENSKRTRRAYKQRSENRKKPNQPIEQKKNGYSSVYQEMMQRTQNMMNDDTTRFVDDMDRDAIMFDSEDSDFDETSSIESDFYENEPFDMFEDENRPIW